jgi:integrase
MDLTDIEIKSTKPGEKEFTLNAGEGLYLRIKPTGKRSWRLNYWLLGKPRFMSIGSYPEVTLKEARAIRNQARADIARGIDPNVALVQKKEAVVELTARASEEAGPDDTITVAQVTPRSPFRTLALAWFNHWKVGKAPAYTSRTRARLTDNLFPVLATKPIDEIDAPDLKRMARSVEIRLGDRGTELAQRSIQIAGMIFRFAISEELLKRNPAADLKPKDILKPYESDNQAHVEPTDFPALLVAIDQYDGREIVKHATKLMILVFLRTSELLPGQWPELDYQENLWRVPRARMKKVKTRKKIKVKGPHLIPLARQTKELLAKCKALAGNKPFIMPGEFSEKGCIHVNSITEMLKKIGYGGVQTGHGFRGLASTILNEKGFNRDWIEAQLAHISGDDTRMAYNHAAYLEGRREMMQAWADYVDECLKRGYEARAALTSVA